MTIEKIEEVHQQMNPCKDNEKTEKENQLTTNENAVKEMGKDDELKAEIKPKVQQGRLEKIKIDSIIVKDRLREIDEVKVENLKDSMDKLGLLNPITVSKDNRLIAGQHRLEASRALGWTEIDAIIVDLDEDERTLAEIDENIMRNNPHYIERGEMLKKRKEIYERKYPETRQGGDRRSEEAKSKRTNCALIPCFSEDTANRLNISKRTVQKEIQLAENLTPDAKQWLKNHDIPKTEAEPLSKLEPEKQNEAIQRVNDGKSKTLKAAIKAVSEPEPEEPKKPEKLLPPSHKDIVLAEMRFLAPEELEDCISIMQKELEEQKGLMEFSRQSTNSTAGG